MDTMIAATAKGWRKDRREVSILFLSVLGFSTLNRLKHMTSISGSEVCFWHHAVIITAVRKNGGYPVFKFWGQEKNP